MKLTRAGTIYIVKNPHYAENYYKVGKTSRTGKDRLSDEENPSAFSLEDGSIVIGEYAVYDLNKVEGLIHQALSEYRIDSSKKEWFKIELTELKRIIKNIVNENNFREIEEPPNQDSIAVSEDNLELNENITPKKKPKSKFLKFVGIAFWVVGIFSGLGGGGSAALFFIITGVIIHWAFR